MKLGSIPMTFLDGQQARPLARPTTMRHWPLWLRSLNKRLVQFQEMFLRNQRVIGLPFYLTLESGNSCNLRCPLCPTTFRGNSMPRGMLTLANAQTILDRFPALLVVNFSLWGEPFLNKDIFDIIKYARSKKIRAIIQSNFSLPRFDEAMAQKLLDSDLSELCLSIDGATQEGYEAYRRRGDFALVVRNIELLRRMQKEQGRQNPSITWKMVVNRFNEHEIPAAKAEAERLGVAFQLVEIYTPETMKDDWKPVRSVEDAGLPTHDDKSAQCYQLWQVMTVNFNGDVFPCCSEWSPKDSLGNVLNEPVSAIWNHAEYRRRRGNNKSGPPRCDDCHTDKETRYWLEWHDHQGRKNPAMLPLASTAHRPTPISTASTTQS
jgi:radical SAM protein with 4Fe4S-binding SPASM domain